ncbi:MAG: hypothetical protein HKN52_10655 [Eudoraea sp.]|nr:hypothetical protein [Eudoraea sp.]
MSSKNSTMRTSSILTIFSVAFLLLTGCEATQTVMLTSLEPAPVLLSKEIKRIGIIDESITLKKEEYSDKLDELVSIEDGQLQKQWKDAAINGLYGELLRDQRFDTILMLNNIEKKGKVIQDENAEIPWESIKQLCDMHNIDAVFSLAYYDTDTQISVKKTSMEELDLLRMRVKVAAQEVTLETLIENGWRIYDPYNKEIIDELTFSDQIISSAKETTSFRALESMYDRKDSIIAKSRSTGSTYGLRLLPFNKQIERDYFIKGTPNFVKAAQLVQEDKWNEASALWQLETINQNPKIQAKACFNMAVYMEVSDDLPQAIAWIHKSIGYDDTKKSTAYLAALKHRSEQNFIAEQQLINGLSLNK